MSLILKQTSREAAEDMLKLHFPREYVFNFPAVKQYLEHKYGEGSRRNQVGLAQPPMQQSGGMDNDAVNEEVVDFEVDIAQQETSTSTPARKSRKNMVFARQSNGRFGRTKAGASKSMPARKKKKWI
ncbi:hypothetical protein BDZ91DRAFT_745620 [Kalaharituber pfeilii]|nr:hypothetical protein BDZ91DRAFT_745620 [Kalaharituber pfeilii]